MEGVSFDLGGREGNKGDRTRGIQGDVVVSFEFDRLPNDGLTVCCCCCCYSLIAVVLLFVLFVFVYSFLSLFFFFFLDR